MRDAVRYALGDHVPMHPPAALATSPAPAPATTLAEDEEKLRQRAVDGLTTPLRNQLSVGTIDVLCGAVWEVDLGVSG